MAYAILLIGPGRWLQAKTQQPIGVVSLVIIIHVNGRHTLIPPDTNPRQKKPSNASVSVCLSSVTEDKHTDALRSSVRRERIDTTVIHTAMSRRDHRHCF